MKMSFDDYDGLCDAMSGLGNGQCTVPSWEAIRRIEQYDISLTLGLLVYFYENTNAASADEKKRRSYINEIIRDEVEFDDEGDPAPQTVAVCEDEYEGLMLTAEKCSEFMPKKLPGPDKIGRLVGTSVRYCCLLDCCLYSMAASGNKALKEYLRNVIKENFVFKWANKPVEITITEYEALKKDFQTDRFKVFREKSWIPTVEQIREYIVPDIRKTYDFVLCIIEVMPVKTRKEQAAMALLKEVFNKNVRILDKTGGRMKTIWS